MPKKRQCINLMDVTSTDELGKLKQFPKLIGLLVKDIKELTLDELVQLSNAQVYCSLSVSIHDELVDRLEFKQTEVC